MSRIVLAVLIDAFGWDLLEKHPFLGELPSRRPLRTILGFSSAAIPSLLTGKKPSEHGRWFLYRMNRDESPFGFARLLAPLEGHGGVGRFVRTLYTSTFDFFTEITGYYHLYNVPLRLLPFFDLPEHRPVYEPGGVEGVETLFDRLAAGGVPHRVWYWRTPEEENMEEFVRAAGEGAVPFLFFYGSALDALMHVVGTEGEETGERIALYEEWIRRAVAEAEKRFDQVELFVFSDHGMVDVAKRIDLMNHVRSLPFREGKEYLPFYDSTFARFRFFDRNAEDGIRSLLTEAEGGRLLADEELEALGVLFPRREYGEAVFVTDAGTVIAPSFMGESTPAGMHGYHPDDSGSSGFLLSNRPLPREVRSIMDMASLLEEAALRAHQGERDGAER